MINLHNHLLAITRANLETTLDLAHGSFASVERLANLNLNTTRALLEHGIEHTRSVMAVKSTQEMLELQTKATQPVLNHTLAYLQNAQQIVTLSHQEHKARVQQQVADMGQQVAATVEHAVAAVTRLGKPIK